ncbi:hypothetical protein C7B62_20845 [Pleurocapsa sp. CCALA 161]|uniref:hypothetical protein n=1 Tax=Pleurocapsa sp. CCALA 161 TaxID=2107688 RepID=UPI000D06B6C6|nr:hypothetical protein [Pleurocapsa sp. CCALA 161]PSB07119.1 hypothetical protein C7B62_20845 [Pleurocapsa sp. CCALA 161]
MTNENDSVKTQPNTVTIEYEGQKYPVEKSKIEGLEDRQILDLLCVGFPGMANGKLERLEDGSIKIIKRVGTKGRDRLLELLGDFPEDDLPIKIESLNTKLTEELTVSEWSEIYETLDFDRVQSICEQRKNCIDAAIRRLYFGKSNIVPLI